MTTVLLCSGVHLVFSEALLFYYKSIFFNPMKYECFGIFLALYYSFRTYSLFCCLMNEIALRCTVYSLDKWRRICTNDAVIYMLMKRFVNEPLAGAVLGIHCLICLEGVFSSTLILIRKNSTRSKLHQEICPCRHREIKFAIEIYI